MDDIVNAKKILVHAINYAPEIIGCGKYTAELVQYLGGRGHTVEIITAPPHYPGWSVQAPYRAFTYTSDVHGSIKVTRCPIIAKKNGGGLWRLLAPLSFAIAASPVVVWRMINSRPDLLLCVEPTLFATLVALPMAKFMRIRCVLHVQDLEVDAAFEVGHVKGKFFHKVAVSVERRILKSFDRIITISIKMRERLISKTLDPHRVVIVRNWVDTNAIRPIDRNKPNSFRQNLSITNTQFVVLYAGHIGPKQALDVVLKAARHLKDQEDIHFVIAGEGPQKERLKAENADLENVSYLPLQPVDRLNELLGMADLHVLPQHKNAADLVLPSKLGGMLASGRPIVATADAGTELHDVLTRIAYLTPAGDFRALSEAICRAKKQVPDRKVELGLRLAENLGSCQMLPQFERELCSVLEDMEPAVV